MRTILYAALLALTITFSAGCATQRPEVNSLSDAIVVTSADIESLATELRRMCGNTVAGGPCRSGSLVSTTSKNHLAGQLRTALEAVKTANLALIQDEAIDAENHLARAHSILVLVREEVDRRDR